MIRPAVAPSAVAALALGLSLTGFAVGKPLLETRTYDTGKVTGPAAASTP